jgi:curved DNA-binding protein CbpA
VTGLFPAESFILSRLDAPLRLEELVAISGLPDSEAYSIIYGLALSGLLEREHWQNAFRTVADKPRNTQPTVTPLVAGVFEKADDETDLEQFLERVNNAADHYEILTLPLRADTDEVKSAYYALARRYHPDRFHLRSGTSLHAKLGSAFARVTQAYETLMDTNARAAYDSARERTRQFQQSVAAKDVAAANEKLAFDSEPEGEALAPEQNFQKGLNALQEGRINAAINHLAAAARLAPNESRYRAHYGKALAATERTRRLAESELQAALKLEPKNANYHVLLAQLYFDLQFHRRAQSEVERALALDPNHGGATLLMRKLQKSS